MNYFKNIKTLKQKYKIECFFTIDINVSNLNTKNDMKEWVMKSKKQVKFIRKNFLNSWDFKKLNIQNLILQDFKKSGIFLQFEAKYIHLIKTCLKDI